MTSLKESVRKSWVDWFGVGMSPTLGWPGEWADSYIKELEQHMKRWTTGGGEPNCTDSSIAMTIEEVLRFLKGESHAEYWRKQSYKSALKETGPE